ncbi:hypothetical protein PQG02_00450 (plasmid) [Nostoc sp. UHCC 0926]|nr:hypothetical protein PQG02_00450 [Nostoc sp. UHCC 0926]
MMIDKELVGCVTLLSQSKTYFIDGTLYRYLSSSDSIRYTQYYFRPLARQSKTADLKLNRDKVLRRCYEVPSLYKQHTAEINHNSIQLSLF